MTATVQCSYAQEEYVNHDIYYLLVLHIDDT